MTTATMTNGHSPLPVVEDTPDESGVHHGNGMIGRVTGQRVELADCVVVSVQGQDEITIADSMVGAAMAQGDLSLAEAGNLVASAGRDLQLTNGGTGLLAAGRDAVVTNGGAGFMLAGRDVIVESKEQQAALVAVGQNVTIRNGKIALLMANHATVDEGTRVLVELSPQKLVDAALTLVAVPFAVWGMLRSRRGG